MLYIHENNLLGKCEDRDNNPYRYIRNEIKDFYNNYYIPMRESVRALNFQKDNYKDFQKATEIFNNYYSDLINFSKKHSIKSQSKFESTFLEEISAYLFKDMPEITSNKLGVFNKGIYAGMKIDANHHIGIIKKDVDFCIGKKVTVVFGEQKPITIILPIVAVEVKTYLDATMFGEVKSSSKAIKSASPTSKTYILMGYKCLADEHIISARQDSVLNEIFVLRKNELSPMDVQTIYDYWLEITVAVNQLLSENLIKTPGRLLKP